MTYSRNHDIGHFIIERIFPKFLLIFIIFILMQIIYKNAKIKIKLSHLKDIIG